MLRSIDVFICLTLWSRVPEDLTGSQLVKKFPKFYGTPKLHYRFYKCPPPVPTLSVFIYLTLWSRVPEDLTGSQLVKKFPKFYGTPKVHYRFYKCPPPVPTLSVFIYRCLFIALGRKIAQATTVLVRPLPTLVFGPDVCF